MIMQFIQSHDVSGHGIPRLLKAILQLFPLDTYEAPVSMNCCLYRAMNTYSYITLKIYVPIVVVLLSSL